MRKAARGHRSSITAIAERFGRRPSTVRRILAETGFRSRRLLIGYPDDVVLGALLARRRLGVPVEQLAAETGIDERVIRDQLRGTDTPPGPHRPRAVLPMGVEAIAAAYRAGSSITALAGMNGSSYGTIRRVLLDQDVQLRGGRKQAARGDEAGAEA
jgi:hypothetical protein